MFPAPSLVQFFFNNKYLNMLIRNKFGSITSNKHIINLSSYSLCDGEKLVLSTGLDFFYLPPRNINKVITFSEFEILFSQLQKYSPTSGVDF